MQTDTTNPVEGEALPSSEAFEENMNDSVSTTEQAASQETDGDSDDQREAEEQFEEVERNGKKAIIPTWLKPELLMQADYTRKTQELAAARRALETERESVQQISQAELSAYTNLQVIDRQIDHFAKTDWNAAFDGDAAAAQKAFIQFQLLKDARRETTGYIEQLRSQRISREQQQTAKRLEDCNAEVAKHLSDWSAATAAKLKQEGMQHFGFSAEDVDGIDDPRIILALHAAVRWKDHEDKLRKAEAFEKQQAVKPAAKPSGGGAPPAGLDDQLSAEEWLRRRNNQLRKRT